MLLYGAVAAEPVQGSALPGWLQDGTRGVSPCSQPRALSYSPIHGLWLPVATRERKPTCHCSIIIFRKICALESSWRRVSELIQQTWAEHPPGGSPGRPGWGFAGALGTAPLSRDGSSTVPLQRFSLPRDKAAQNKLSAPAMQQLLGSPQGGTSSPG